METSLLLSGSFDRTIALVDVRSPDKVTTCEVDADLEAVKWCPSHPFLFLASTGQLSHYPVTHIISASICRALPHAPCQHLASPSQSPGR